MTVNDEYDDFPPEPIEADQHEAILNGFELAAIQHAYSLPTEVHKRFNNQRRVGQCIASDLPCLDDTELVDRMRASRSLSTMPLSVYLKTEKAEITKVGEVVDRPVYWLGNFGLYIMSENENSTWEISLSFPSYPPGW